MDSLCWGLGVRKVLWVSHLSDKQEYHSDGRVHKPNKKVHLNGQQNGRGSSHAVFVTGPGPLISRVGLLVEVMHGVVFPGSFPKYVKSLVSESSVTVLCVLSSVYVEEAKS